MSDVDVDEPEAMDDSAEDPVEPGDEEGDENDNPNRQQNPECNDAPEPTDEDAESSEKAERLHKFPLGRIKNIMKQGGISTRFNHLAWLKMPFSHSLLKCSLRKRVESPAGPGHEHGVAGGRLSDLQSHGAFRGESRGGVLVVHDVQQEEDDRPDGRRCCDRCRRLPRLPRRCAQ